MESTGAGPAVRSSKYGAWSEAVAHARQLSAEQIEHLVPRQFYELIATATIIRPRPPLEPATSHHRLRDSCMVTQRVGKVLDEMVWVRIPDVGAHFETPIRHAR
jgi:hypothetical protein